MEVTLTSTLGVSEKGLLRSWLIQALNNECVSSSGFPFSGRLALYIDGRPLKLQAGLWIITTDNIYLAKEDQDVPLSERLPILLTLSTLCEPSEELTRACSKAITNYLLGEYRSLSSSLIASAVPPSGIAFSCDNRVASLLGTEWMLPSGEVVDVSGPDWMVCASSVPATTDLDNPPTFEGGPVDVEFNAAPFGPAFPPTEAHGFNVGDRVSYTEVPRVGPRRETGVVANTSDGRLDIKSDETGFIWSFGGFANLLTLIETTTTTETTEFRIGQRVHWNGGTAFGEHDCTVRDLPVLPTRNFYNVVDDDNRLWAAVSSELRAI